VALPFAPFAGIAAKGLFAHFAASKMKRLGDPVKDSPQAVSQQRERPDQDYSDQGKK
jgi:hypothetical protein